MRAPWAWIRNTGVGAMLIAVGLWLFAGRTFGAWLAALALWLLGCVFVSAAGLAFLHRLEMGVTEEQSEPKKARGAAA